MKKPSRPAKRAAPKKKSASRPARKSSPPPRSKKAAPKPAAPKPAAKSKRPPKAKPAAARKPAPAPTRAASRPAAPTRAAARPAAPPARTAPRGPQRPQPKAVERDNGFKDQVSHFESAMRLFHRGEFEKARELYRQAAAGPNREMAHTAGMHINMCERRLSSQQPEPETAEERYTLAVALMNQGRLADAEAQFRESLRMHESADHVHYSLSLCLGLQGKLDDAGRHLLRAIELRPQNRALARSDPDFLPIAHRPALRVILYPEREESG